MNIEQRLAELAKCGILLREGVNLEEVIEEFGADALQGDDWLPWVELLAGPPGETEEDLDQYVCESLYFFDTELGLWPGPYAPMIRRFGQMTQGALNISDIADSVDFDEANSQVAFVCNNRPISIRFKQDEDWFNWTVLDLLAAELEKSGSALRYFAVDLDGQAVIIGCLTPAQVGRLAALGVPLLLLDKPVGPDGPSFAQEGRAGHDAGVAYIMQELNKKKPWWQRLFGK
jgi:hypothetical protein